MSERLRYWQGKLAELESSGLSRAAFCRRRRINYQTMTSWVKRLRDEGGPASDGLGSRSRHGSGLASGGSDAAGFIEVSLPGSPGNARPNDADNSAAQSPRFVASPMGPTPYEVLLGSNRAVRVGGDFDEEALARLIRVVESC